MIVVDENAQGVQLWLLPLCSCGGSLKLHRWRLRKEGKTADEIFKIREAEAKAGKLKLGDQGSLLNALTAEEADVNWTTGEAKNTYTRSVVYIPWATAESTGLPLKPAGPGLPWIMDPGTHRAHIMINPARD